MTAEPPPPRPTTPGLWGQLADFVNNMDARAWRAVFVTTALFVAVGVVLVIGRLFFGDEVERFVRTWLGGAERAHWGLPAAILIFTVAAFIGAPQFLLIAACVVAFSPEVGFWYAWIATIVSGAVTFLVGVVGGQGVTRRYAGATGGRFTRFMDKNAFWASFVVRFVPTAPFIVVNMTMGAARMKFLPFIGGLALGVLPKTAIVAFAGDGIMDALEGNFGMAALAAAAVILIWFAVVYITRRVVRRDDNGDDGGA